MSGTRTSPVWAYFGTLKGPEKDGGNCKYCQSDVVGNTSTLAFHLVSACPGIVPNAVVQQMKSHFGHERVQSAAEIDFKQTRINFGSGLTATKDEATQIVEDFFLFSGCATSLVGSLMAFRSFNHIFIVLQTQFVCRGPLVSCAGSPAC